MGNITEAVKKALLDQGTIEITHGDVVDIPHDTIDLTVVEIVQSLRDQGYVICPIEPTEEMVLAAMKVKDSSGIGRWVKHINIHERYKAMIEASHE